MEGLNFIPAVGTTTYLRRIKLKNNFKHTEAFKLYIRLLVRVPLNNYY